MEGRYGARVSVERTCGAGVSGGGERTVADLWSGGAGWTGRSWVDGGWGHGVSGPGRWGGSH